MSQKRKAGGAGKPKPRKPAKKPHRARKAAPRTRRKAPGRPRVPPDPKKGRKGAGRRDLPKAAVLKAIEKSRGLVSAVARRLGCHWLTAKRYVEKWPETQEAMSAELQLVLDLGEGKLFTAVQKGEEWAIKFLLSRKGKTRGYSERQEMTGPEGEPLAAILVAPKRFDSAKDWQEYVQTVPQGHGAPAPVGEHD